MRIKEIDKRLAEFIALRLQILVRKLKEYAYRPTVRKFDEYGQAVC